MMKCVIIFLFTLILLSSCAPEETPITPETKATEQEVTKVKDTGDFKVIYSPLRNQNFLEYESIFKEAKLFETIAEDLNAVIALPTDITIVLIECGEENAFYTPDSRQIIMCYELMDHFAGVFYDYTESEEELGTAMLYSMFFVLYHEMGHALVDVLDLPTTGREEDAVDQLATLVLIESGVEGEDAALTGATWFGLKGAQQTDDLAFWDEHSLDQQRFYDIICLIYGKNPAHSWLIEEGILPEERAIRCEQEYLRASNSWDAILAPYTKE